jgi:superfamily II DNA or RNA helicase
LTRSKKGGVLLPKDFIEITMSNNLSFNIDGLDKEMISKIKKDFRVINPQYDTEQMMKIKKKDTIYDVPKFLNIYDINDNVMEIPRGSSSFLSYWFDEYGYEYDIVDKRLSFETKIELPEPELSLYKHQEAWVKKGVLLTQGTVQSPCGSGKTIAGIELIRRIGQPALVIVPDNELLKQWVDSIIHFLGQDVIPHIGVFTSDKVLLSDNRTEIPHKIMDITVTTNQSAYNMIHDETFVNSFGLVLIDEAHMVAARTFREVMGSFPAKYKYGLTATPYRNDSLTDLIEAYCGTQFHTVTDDDLLDVGLVIKPKLEVIKTNFKYSYDVKYARYMYNKILTALENNEERNRLIVETVADEIRDKRVVLVITKRVKHCHVLAKMLKQEFPKRNSVRVAIMAGDNYDFEAAEMARNGQIDVIFAVNRAKQGLDIKPLETVCIVAPRKAKGEIEQIVGRVMRADVCFGKYDDPTKKEAKVIDFLDEGVKMLNNSYKQRYSVYKNKCIIE